MSKRKTITQYAALPFALKNGQPRVMLVTSRGKGRWIIPKGWPEKALQPHASAAKEAYEEAGIVGTVDKRPIGTYRYTKRLGSGARTVFEVEAYLLHVERQLRDWPEKGQRLKRWVAPAQAARLVRDEGLVRLLLKLDAPQTRRARGWNVAPTPHTALQVLTKPFERLTRLAQYWARIKSQR